MATDGEVLGVLVLCNFNSLRKSLWTWTIILHKDRLWGFCDDWDAFPAHAIDEPDDPGFHAMLKRLYTPKEDCAYVLGGLDTQKTLLPYVVAMALTDEVPDA